MNKTIKAVLIFAILIAFTVPVFVGTSCSKKNPRAKHKVLVLGIDGMDFHVTWDMIKKGKLPNFGRLAQEGGFKPLLSSIPAQSPVAWSNFITGQNPGGHAIFDFIHRDPKTLIPFLSTTKMESSDKFIPLLKYRIPRGSGKIELLRQGEAFWQILEREGIPSTIFKIPSNFPPAPFKGESLSGMGTPDITGSYGEFTYFTDNPPDNADSFTGGKAYTVWVEGNEVRAELEGPQNIFLNEDRPPASTCPFTVYIDPEREAAKIEIGDEEIVLNVGDWSQWVEVEFKMMPTVKTSGIVRFLLKEVRPDFKLYASPININPLNPALPISTPDDYVTRIAESVGLFYTQGMPQDTKALQYGVLTDKEYAQQSRLIIDERMRLFEYEFGRWDEGLLFFYFCTLDLNQHTWWRAKDKKHPMWTNELQIEYGDFIENLYIEFDDLLGKVMDNLGPEDTLIVMSDHGFAPYRRQFNLNSWLLENGYLFIKDEYLQDQVEYLEGVDWDRTRAYSLGINALYINLKGREEKGIVGPDEAEGLVREIASKLDAVVDSESPNGTNERPIRKAYISKEEFSGDYVDVAPDIIVGYNRGYRGSDDSALGRFPIDILLDNKDTWSGDHCIDPKVVPAILLSNRKINGDLPRLYDLTVTILKEYGIEPSPEMIGKPVW